MSKTAWFKRLLSETKTPSAAVTRGRFVDKAGDQVTTRGVKAFGVGIDTLDADDVAASRKLSVTIVGIEELEVAEAVTVGERLTTDANGKGAIAAAGEEVNAIALTAGSADGDRVAALLVTDGGALHKAFTDNSGGTAGATIAAGVGVYNLTFQFDLADIADGDLVTDLVLGHKFKVLESFFVATEPVTTAAKATTLSLDIGATPITNSDIGLTSANCTPAGAVVDNAGALAANTGGAADTVTVKAASTTAFAEGKGVLVIRIQNMDLADAIASLADRGAV